MKAQAAECGVLTSFMLSKRTTLKTYWNTGQVACHKNVLGNLLLQILLRPNSHVYRVFIKAVPKNCKTGFCLLYLELFPRVPLSPWNRAVQRKLNSLGSNAWRRVPVRHLSSAGMPSAKDKWQLPIGLMGWLVWEMQDLTSCFKIPLSTRHTDSGNIPTSVVFKTYVNWQVDKLRELSRVIIIAVEVRLPVNLNNLALHLWILL